MARVFRQQYTRPIPDGAQRTKDKKGRPAVRFKGPDGKPVVAPLTKKGDRCRLASPTWYGRVPGASKPVPLCTNKAAAEIMLADLVKKAAMGKAGAADPFEKHNKRPLADHLDDYRRELVARDSNPRYVNMVHARLTALFEGCGFVFYSDLSASKATDWLAELRRPARARVALEPGKMSFTLAEAGEVLGIKRRSVSSALRRACLKGAGHGKVRVIPRATVEALQDRLCQGKSVTTTNQYLTHLKSFCLWMVKDGRAGGSPVAHLEGGNDKLDRRHDRRELLADELRRLLALTRASARTFRGLGGRDRFHLYATACATGFRAAALASLAPESFDLTGDTPTVTLPARKNKSRKLRVQPLPADVAELLRDYFEGKPAGQPVWPGAWYRDGLAAEMLRGDLTAAGIPYIVEGPDGPLFADFHALRHTYLTLLGKGGVDLRTAQELAGHSSPTITARYAHRRLHDLAGAVEKLPAFLPGEQPEGEAVRATGTDDTAPKATLPYTPLTQGPDLGRPSMMSVDRGVAPRAAMPSRRNSLPCNAVDSDRSPLMPGDAGEGEGGQDDDGELRPLPALAPAICSASWCMSRIAVVPRGSH
jgi:integrase